MTALAPTEVGTGSGGTFARWGQSPGVPLDVPLDLVPTVWAASGQVEVEGLRLTPDQADALAERLRAAAAHARGAV